MDTLAAGMEEEENREGAEGANILESPLQLVGRLSHQLVMCVVRRYMARACPRNSE